MLSMRSSCSACMSQHSKSQHSTAQQRGQLPVITASEPCPRRTSSTPYVLHCCFAKHFIHISNPSRSVWLAQAQCLSTPCGQRPMCCANASSGRIVFQNSMLSMPDKCHTMHAAMCVTPPKPTTPSPARPCGQWPDLPSCPSWPGDGQQQPGGGGGRWDRTTVTQSYDVTPQ
jgi:hypothetical protein